MSRNTVAIDQPNPGCICDRYASPYITKLEAQMGATRRSWLVLLVAAISAWALGVGTASAQNRDVLVFAAASLKNALDQVAAQWQRETGKKVTISYAASNTLIKQIEQGAPADIFVSADLDWMDYGQQKNLIKPDSRSNLLGNRLVLIAPKGSTLNVNMQPGVDIAALLKGGRLAMGNVDAVPAGKYAKAALEKLGAWDAVKDKIAQTDNVRAALVFVSRGEAPLGIVYQTDAAADPAVRIVGTFPENTHPPIIYPIALTKDTTNADAQAFLNYIRSAATRATFERQGFTVLAPGGQRS
jgi:molybdate transport system substrate-binding protein